MFEPNSIATPAKFLGKFAQIEQNLEHALRDFPDPSALDRIKFALALIEFIRTQVALDAAAARSARAAGSPRP